MSLVILLSTYNGEEYLKEQLDSLLAQDYKDFEVLVRDDGSIDGTIDILKDYASKYSFIKYYIGNNMGPYKSFWDLLKKTDEKDYYALCDQDDMWFKDKLSSAVNMMKKEDNNIPLLYCCNYQLTDKYLNPIETNISGLFSYTDFAHSLLYTSRPGCTFVFNNEARKKILEYDINSYTTVHDSLIHKIVCMFGKMMIDDNAHIYYRQHENNYIGLLGNKRQAFFARIKRFAGGSAKNARSNCIKALLNTYENSCSSTQKELMNIVANYQNDRQLKKKMLTDKRFKVRGINYLFFKLLVLFNYI